MYRGQRLCVELKTKVLSWALWRVSTANKNMRKPEANNAPRESMAWAIRTESPSSCALCILGHQDGKPFILCALHPAFLHPEPHISVLSTGWTRDSIHHTELSWYASRAGVDFRIGHSCILLNRIKRVSPSMFAWSQSEGHKCLSCVMETSSETMEYSHTGSLQTDLR